MDHNCIRIYTFSFKHKIQVFKIDFWVCWHECGSFKRNDFFWVTLTLFRYSAAPRFEPGATVYEALILPLCYASWVKVMLDCCDIAYVLAKQSSSDRSVVQLFMSPRLVHWMKDLWKSKMPFPFHFFLNKRLWKQLNIWADLQGKEVKSGWAHNVCEDSSTKRKFWGILWALS